MILDTPAADRTSPTTKAITPRIKRASETPERPTPDLRAKKEKIARVGVNAEAENFFRGGIDEIEAIVRNRMGKEMTTTVKNPSIHSVGFETAAPAIATSGKATTSKNHDRISIPTSLRKFRTLSPRRIIAEVSASPTKVGITTPINGKRIVAWRPIPARGRERTDASRVRVRKTERTSGVDGKPTLRMKLKAPTVPPTPPDAF
jgi:hypothetical protein